MSSDVAIRVQGLAKRYKISPARPQATLTEELLGRVRHPRRRPSDGEFWALRDVNFEVRKGEVLGLIGGNGAGKSTLLRILSRVTPPTSGEIHLRGRVGSLLEVGTGFHPELTGRENIYLNGAILGMNRREIARAFDDIVEFAEIASFLETPVKRYSSGMYVRLAFAVAAHLRTEVLLVDEVLAVGDQAFQRRCIGAMGEAAYEGRTVLVVSHNLGVVSQLCTSALLLKTGRAVRQGATADVIADYLSALRGSEASRVFSDRDRWSPENLARDIEFVSAGPALDDASLVAAGGRLNVNLQMHMARRVERFRLSYTIFSIAGGPVGSAFSGDIAGTALGSDLTEVRMELPLPNLAPGHYNLGLGLAAVLDDGSTKDLDVVLNVLPFEVGPTTSSDGLVLPWYSAWGSVQCEAPLVAVGGLLSQ